MKKLIAGMAVSALLVTGAQAYSPNNVNVFMGDAPISSEGVIKEGRTLLPLRSICETLGGSVEWNETDRTVTVNSDGKTAKFTIGSNIFETQNGNITLDCAPVIINDRTFVPVRALFEFLDCNVSWDNGNVNIEKPQKPEQTEKPDAGNNEIGGGTDNGEETAPEETGLSMQAFNLVNEEREKHGLSPLKYSKELEAVAYAHSKDMAEKNFFSHTNLEGLSPFDRMRNAGLSYSYAAENIAAGQTTAAAVMNSWMNSDGHRKNILNPNLTEIGIGVANGGSYGIYWTQLFRSK